MISPVRRPWLWGVTPRDLALLTPADHLLESPAAEAVRAVQVTACPATVYRWLCQLRVAPYSYDLVDNGGRRSPRTLTPGLEQLRTGQPFMTIFRLQAFEPCQWMRLRLKAPGARRLYGELVVTYAVRPSGGGCRLVSHLVWERPPGPLPRLRSSGLAWGDLLMMRQQLLTLRDLAEQADGAPRRNAPR